MFDNKRDSPKSPSWITPTPDFHQSVKFYLSHLHAHSDRSVGAENKGQAATGSPARAKTDRPRWAQMIRYYVFVTKLWGKDAACLYAGRVPPMMEPDTAGKENDDDTSVIRATYEESARIFWGRHGVSRSPKPEESSGKWFTFRSIVSSGCQRRATEIQPPFSQHLTFNVWPSPVPAVVV